MAETGAIIRGGDEIRRNIRAVRKAVDAGMFAPAVEAGLRVIVNDIKDPMRPLAWNDVTGNLRASISFQIEGELGPKPTPELGEDGIPTGRLFNTTAYKSGRIGGVFGVVFAPPDYAIELEARSGYSVLLAPLNRVRAKLRAEMAGGGRGAWKKFVISRRALGGAT